MKKPLSLISIVLLLLTQSTAWTDSTLDCDIQKKDCDALFPDIINEIDRELNKPQYFQSPLNAQRHELIQLNDCYTSALVFRPYCRNKISPYQAFIARALLTACDAHDFNCDHSAAYKGMDHFGGRSDESDCSWDDLFCDNRPSL